MRDIGIDAGAPADGGFVGFGARRARICFLYIAQAHQVLHSISVAVELARGWSGFEVEVAATTRAVLDYACQVVDGLGGAPIRWRLLGPTMLRALAPQAGSPPKLPMLAANAALLNGYDVIVTPERTTAALRRMGVTRPRLVYTQHGAGDRKGPFEPRLKRFDLVFAAGSKQRDRMVGSGLVAADKCAVVGYPKFDVAAPGDLPRLFADDRPVVVYNPHFHRKLGSWDRWGAQVLEAFADQDDFNLIFAPHLRLFAGRRADPVIRRLTGHPRIHVDLGGSVAGIDMTYTRLADIYLGDVSSQVYEFIRDPRPCVFLNPTGAAWADDESFAHFRFGDVLGDPGAVMGALAAAGRRHSGFAAAQLAGLRSTFGESEVRPSLRAAQAISRLATATELASAAAPVPVAAALAD